MHGSCDQQPSIIRECAPLVGLRNVTLAKSIENHSENRSKIDPQRRLGAPKSESKSLPGPSRETPWRERASRRRLRSVSGASRSVPGVLRECLENLKGRPGTQKGHTGAPGSAPRRSKSTPSRVRERKNRVFFVLRVREASSEQLVVNFRRFSFFLQSLRTLESAAPASKNRGSALHAPSRIARTMQPRKTTKIGPKIDAKSSKITSRSGQCQ